MYDTYITGGSDPGYDTAIDAYEPEEVQVTKVKIRQWGVRFGAAIFTPVNCTKLEALAIAQTVLGDVTRVEDEGTFDVDLVE